MFRKLCCFAFTGNVGVVEVSGFEGFSGCVLTWFEMGMVVLVFWCLFGFG